MKTGIQLAKQNYLFIHSSLKYEFFLFRFCFVLQKSIVESLKHVTVSQTTICHYISPIRQKCHGKTFAKSRRVYFCLNKQFVFAIFLQKICLIFGALTNFWELFWLFIPISRRIFAFVNALYYSILHGLSVISNINTEYERQMKKK